MPNETAEQKAKRLRKEARRHLRVTFRPDASLVAIKYFSHDPEEELGHDENFTRDAGDLGGEGHMFKQHKELEEDDDDDDDETEYRPWAEPSQVDFSVVDAEERLRTLRRYLVPNQSCVLAHGKPLGLKRRKSTFKAMTSPPAWV